MTDIKPQDIEAIVESFEASSWKEMRLKVDGLEMFLSKDAAARASFAASAAAGPTPHVQNEAGALHATAAPHLTRGAPPPSATSPKSARDGWVAVRAPNLGTFYRAPKPGAAPYVAIGQRVEATTEVCLIEVMKLFTSVPAGVAGVVREVLVEDADVVEFDQALFLIEPT